MVKKIKNRATAKSKLAGMKIAVLAGGTSSERAVSLRSGAAVEAALKSLGARTKKIIVGRSAAWLSRVKKIKPDFVFIALHGTYGEDGGAQAALDGAGFSYCGSGAAASALAMDKIASKRIFEARGIPTPPWFVARPDGAGSPSNAKLKFPVVVKPSREGSAVGVKIAADKKEYAAALRSARKFSRGVLVEKYIPGAELTAAVLDGKSLPLIEIIPKGRFYDYRSKYSPGMSRHIIPARIKRADARKAAALAVKTFDALGCRAFARVDMKLSSEDGRLYVFEANTIPGLTSTSLFPEAAAAAGFTFEKTVEKMILASLKN